MIIKSSNLFAKLRYTNIKFAQKEISKNVNNLRFLFTEFIL